MSAAFVFHLERKTKAVGKAPHSKENSNEKPKRRIKRRTPNDGWLFHRVAGFFAVVVALIAKGFIYALITLGLIIAVQQLEGHVLQPLVMGRAVSIHPLAVVLAIAGGGVLAGIVGALLAVPTVAFLNGAVRVLLAREPAAEEAAMEAESGPVVKGEADDVEATSD